MLTRGALSRPINVEGSAVDPDAVCWIVRVGEHVKDARDISRLSIASVSNTGGKQAAETYVGDVVAALDRAGVALIGVVTADMHVTFHARAGGDSDGNCEQSRDAREHGRRGIAVGKHLGVGGSVFMLSVVAWLGKEMIRVGIHPVGEGDVVVRFWTNIDPTCGMLIGIPCSCPAQGDPIRRSLYRFVNIGDRTVPSGSWLRRLRVKLHLEDMSLPTDRR